MGYQPIGTVGSWEQLIIDYYVYVKEVRKFCDFMVNEDSEHLSSITKIFFSLKFGLGIISIIKTNSKIPIKINLGFFFIFYYAIID